MTDEKIYDYLVIGGEHDGEMFSGPYRSVLKLQSKVQPLARLYSKDQPAETINPTVVEYKVIEHITGYESHFFIASNEDLSNVDVDARIRDSKISAKK